MSFEKWMFCRWPTKTTPSKQTYFSTCWNKVWCAWNTLSTGLKHILIFNLSHLAPSISLLWVSRAVGNSRFQRLSTMYAFLTWLLINVIMCINVSFLLETCAIGTDARVDLILPEVPNLLLVLLNERRFGDSSIDNKTCVEVGVLSSCTFVLFL